MNQFQACVKKDISEFLRYHRNILCMLVLMGIGAMVLVTTVIFPGLISQLAVKAPDMITDPEAINELMAKLFPQDVKGSLKIFSSDVGVFYTIAVCLICHSVLPGEIKNGRWLIPVNAGIEKRTLLTSKCFVYSVGMAFPVFAVYNVYYYAASVLLSPNCRYGTALQNSAVLSLSVAFIAIVTILSSVLYEHSDMATLSVIVIVMAAPDALTFFSFGKLFPTYLLTFTYTLGENLMDIILPAIIMAAVSCVLFFFALRKCERAEILR